MSDALKKRKTKVLRSEGGTPETKRGRGEGDQPVRVKHGILCAPSVYFKPETNFPSLGVDVLPQPHLRCVVNYADYYAMVP